MSEPKIPTCATCHRWLTTISTLLIGQCERCLLSSSAEGKQKLAAALAALEPQLVQKELFE